MSATVGVYVRKCRAGNLARSVARSPTGLQRRQEYVNARGVEPSHTAPASESGVSTTLPPEICGVTRSFGAIARHDSGHLGVLRRRAQRVRRGHLQAQALAASAATGV